MAYVVINLHVFVVFKGEFDGEVDVDGIVMNAAINELSAFDPVVAVFLAFLSPGKAVIEDLGVAGPYSKDRTAGNASIFAGNATAFPTSSSIDKFTVMNLGLFHRMRPNSRSEEVLHFDVVDVQVYVPKTVNGSV